MFCHNEQRPAPCATPSEIVFTLLKPDHSPALGVQARTVIRAEPECPATMSSILRYVPLATTSLHKPSLAFGPVLSFRALDGILDPLARCRGAY